MSLFKRQTDRTDPAKILQIKTWVSQLLALDPEIPISISQLQCTEPGCSPVETVVAVMTQPTQTYKIHKPASEIEYEEVMTALSTIHISDP